MSKLRFFTEAEFREWWPFMDERILKCVDEFRAHWGAPCSISPVDGALGRRLGPEPMSGHNIDRWGTVMAVDLFPAGMDTAEDLKRALDCAKRAQATGIGLYTDTQPSFMIHLDVRPDRTADRPRLWCRRFVGQERKYLAITDVLPGGSGAPA